tara:strand:- start:123 stop:1064 length:942 start_codon:yes stop_codon:yes gene_type:complete
LLNKNLPKGKFPLYGLIMKQLSTTLGLVFFLYFANAVSSLVTGQDYNDVLKDSQKITIEGFSRGDRKELDAYLYRATGSGSLPALIALHGAGGIFPYQLWWAREISKKGYSVLFVDHYCTRGHLCEITTGDDDPTRGAIMKNWQSVSPRQRVMDAMAAYHWLSKKTFVQKNSIGLIGWSWGGSSALFAQKFSRKFSLPNGGFKATISFYPNLKHLLDTPQWSRSGPIEQPALILYGKADTLESQESYQTLVAAGYSGEIKVVGFNGAYRKFDELGDYREKYHPSVGYFPKAFNKKAFDSSQQLVTDFLHKNLR